MENITDQQPIYLILTYQDTREDAEYKEFNDFEIGMDLVMTAVDRKVIVNKLIEFYESRMAVLEK